MFTTTKSSWLAKLQSSRAELRELIATYHPGVAKAEQLIDYTITAPKAEIAATVIRERIAAETKDRDILAEFDRAVEREDIQALYSILNSAWFGVPESTSCWQIPGFKVAVSLLDDPPEPEVD